MNNERGLSFGQNVEQEIRQEPESVLENVRGFSKEYGTHQAIDFINSLDSSLARNRRPLILASLGESVSGKTHVERDIVAEVFGLGEIKTKTAKLLEQGEEIPVDGIFWGDLVSLAKVLGRIDENKVFGEFTDEEQHEVTKVLGEFLAEEIKQSQGKRRIIIAEGAGLTGAWLRGHEKFYGVDRSTSAFWDLSRGKGPFKGLYYDSYFLGVVAEPAIRQHGLETRSKLGNVTANPKEAVKALRESGVVFDPQKEQEVMQWAHASASAKAVKVMETQTNDLIIEMAKTGILREMGLYRLDSERLEDDPYYRAEIIGNYLIRYILENNIGARKRGHVFVAHNYELLPEVSFETGILINNLIWEKHPEVAKVVNKR